MGNAIVSLNQECYGKKFATVTAWSNVQEDALWLQEFADELRATANDQWDNNCVLEWKLLNITVSFLLESTIDYSVDINFTLGDLQGNVLGDGLPLSSCVLISTTHVGSRPNRGRVYFSGMSEGQQSNGEWLTSTGVDLRDMVELWATGYTIGGEVTTLQILRRPSAVFPAYVAHQVDSVGRTTATRSQRRRNLE